ncbi:MAG: cytochrome c biogenesis CcdA family protein [Acidimicrobiia bacterium]
MNAPLALALAAGMVGAVNPCGFSLLPAYVGFFISGDPRDLPLDRRLLGAVRASAAVTTGFIVVFVSLGVVFHSLASTMQRYLPWVTMLIGVVIATAGMSVVAGRRIPAPKIALRGLEGRSAVAMATYGVAYALASLSCTIGPFLAVTSYAVNRSMIGGVATYGAYALGMGVIIFILAAASALARPEPSRAMRHASRYTSRIGGLIMIVSGLYAVWYARWELAVYRGDLSNDRFVDAGERVRVDVEQLIETLGPVRLVVATIALSVLAVFGARASRRTPVSPSADDECAAE